MFNAVVWCCTDVRWIGFWLSCRIWQVGIGDMLNIHKYDMSWTVKMLIHEHIWNIKMYLFFVGGLLDYWFKHSCSSCVDGERGFGETYRHCAKIKKSNSRTITWWWSQKRAWLALTKSYLLKACERLNITGVKSTDWERQQGHWASRLSCCSAHD